MKSLFLLFLSFSAMATPLVGDYVYYESDDGDSESAELVSFDSSKNQFQVKYTNKFSGVVLPDVVRMEDAKDMINDEKIEYLLAHCEELNGHKEDISLSMGNFETCLLTDMDSKETFNIGRVPFGVVQMEVKAKDTIKKFILQKFKSGTK